MKLDTTKYLIIGLQSQLHLGSWWFFALQNALPLLGFSCDIRSRATYKTGSCDTLLGFPVSFKWILPFFVIWELRWGHCISGASLQFSLVARIGPTQQQCDWSLMHPRLLSEKTVKIEGKGDLFLEESVLMWNFFLYFSTLLQCSPMHFDAYFKPLQKSKMMHRELLFVFFILLHPFLCASLVEEADVKTQNATRCLFS